MAEWTQNYRYPNEAYSGCDMTASITVKRKVFNEQTQRYEMKTYTSVLGSLSTISYSINMDKHPVRSIGNVNAKDYTIGQRTIAGSLVFAVFNRHFSQDIIEELNVNNTGGTLYLVDEIPPFDITISLANEYGYRSRIVIYGVRMLNEGQVMSINDVYMENTYQFFATDLEYLTDEISYVYSSSERRFKLTDTIEQYNYPSSKITAPAIEYDLNEQSANYWTVRNQQAIKLRASVIQPKNDKNRGIVDFFLDFENLTGTIYVTSESGAITKINIANSSMASSIFYPGSYTAYYLDESEKQSNSIRFEVRSYYQNGRTSPASAIADKISYNSVTLLSKYSDKPIGDITLVDEDGNETIYSSSDNKIIIDSLIPGKYYSVKSQGNELSFVTEDKDNNYRKIETYIRNNADSLLFDNIDEYTSLLYKDTESDPISSIRKTKYEYEQELAMLDKKLENYKEEYNAISEKINRCAELLSLELNLKNNKMQNVNKGIVDIDSPKVTKDKNYNFTFEFNDKVTKADIYSVSKDGVEKLILSLTAYDFYNFSYRFIGKSGEVYFIQSHEDNKLSQRIYFYNLTTEEKNYYLSKEYYHEVISDLDITRLEESLANLLNEITDNQYLSAFMFHMKEIDEPRIINPIYDDMKVYNPLYYLLDANKEQSFTLALTDYENLKNNKQIYRYVFTNRDEYISLGNEYIVFEEDKEYICWIELNNEQISEPITFKINEDNSEMESYELTKFKDIYNSNIKETNAVNEITDTNALNLLPRIIDALDTMTITKEDLMEYIYERRKYIGAYIDSSNSIIDDIKFKDNVLSMKVLEEGSLLIYHGEFINNIFLTGENEIVDLNNYPENLIIVVANNYTLDKKSPVIVINKLERWYELLV